MIVDEHVFYIIVSVFEMILILELKLHLYIWFPLIAILGFWQCKPGKDLQKS